MIWISTCCVFDDVDNHQRCFLAEAWFSVFLQGCDLCCKTVISLNYFVPLVTL